MRNHPIFKLLLFIFLASTFVTTNAQSLYEIKFADKNNVQYKGLLVFFNENNSYMRIGYFDKQYNVVEINYKMEYGIAIGGRKYCMLKKTSNPTFITNRSLPQVYYADYFLWFFTEATGQYDELYTTDDSTFNSANYRKVISYTPLKPGLITDPYLKEFFVTNEYKHTALKKMCGLMPVVLKPLPRMETTKLHLIIVANTNDGTIGKSCENDRERLVKEFKQTADALSIGFKDYVVEGDNFSKSNLLSTLTYVSPGNNDIVIFIYRGHGFRWPNEYERWPRLALFYGKAGPKTDNSNSINLKEVQSILDKKGARLNIVLGDCCNNSDGVSGMTSQSYWESQVTAFTDVSKLRNLFINSKGSIISSAAKPGEVSYAGFDGGLYTRSFISALDYETSYSKTGAIKWENILLSTTKLAYDKSMYCKSLQNGISEVRVIAPY